MAESALVGVLRVLLTANTAEYTTGMKGAAKSTEQFEKAVTDTKGKLEAIGVSARGAEQQFRRLATSFSGEKLIRDAVVTADAVRSVGGAAVLSEKEIRKLAPALEAAREKARLMGAELPKSFHQIADSVQAQAAHLDAATKKTTAWGSALGSVKNLALGFAAGFTLDRVVMGIGRALSQTIAWGDELADLSDKTGISTTGLQRWDFAAKQTGTTLDTLIGAAQELGKRLADGEKSTAGAVAKLGLNLAELKRMAPEQQFETIADALRRVEDAGEQGAIGADLFGKAWKEVIAPIRAGLKELGDEAAKVGAVLDEETIKSMGELSDTWEALKSSGTGLIASVLKPMIPLLRDIAREAANVSGAFAKEGFWSGVGRLLVAQGAAQTGLYSGYALAGRTGGTPSLPKGPGLPQPEPFSMASERVALATVFKPLEAAGARAARHVDDFSLAAQEASIRWRNIVITSDWLLARMGQAAMGFTPPGLTPAMSLGGQANPWGGIANTSLLGWGGSTIKTPTAGFNWGGLGLGGLNAALPYLSQMVAGGSKQAQIGGTAGGALGGILGSSSLFGGLKGLGGFAGILGGIAPFMGPLMGLVGGLIGKLFGPSEGRLASQARGQWIAGMGGGEAFNERFRQAQVSPEEARRLTISLMSAKSRKEVEQAQAAIEAALARNNALLQQQEQIESQIADVESERQRIIDSLKVGYSDVLSIAQKYGISVEGLGKTINQLGTTASFTTIINDLEALNRAAQAAGGELDWGGALAGMKDEINALVQQAIAAGTALPENMRPYLQSLADAGELLDANGQKITDLSTLNWGPAVETDAQKANKAMEALDKTLGELNQTLKDIAAALRGDLPSAAQAGATGIENAINGIDPHPIVVRVNYDDPGYEPREGGAQTYGARGGLVTAAGIQYRQLGGQIIELANRWRPRGTDTVPAMLTPGELVLTLEQQRGLASVLGASGITPDSQGRAGMAGITEQTVVVVQGGGSKEDLLERIMAALPRKTRTNDRGFRTLMRDALGVA